MFILIADFFYADGAEGIMYNSFGALGTIAAEVKEMNLQVREKGGRIESLTLEHRGVSMPVALKDI